MPSAVQSTAAVKALLSSRPMWSLPTWLRLGPICSPTIHPHMPHTPSSWTSPLPRRCVPQNQYLTCDACSTAADANLACQVSFPPATARLCIAEVVTNTIFFQVLYSPPSGGRKLLQTCAVDLANATTLASIITIAEQSAPALSDEATRAALNQFLTPAEVAAVGAAVANLNSYVATAPDATSAELGQYYAESTVSSYLHCFF